MKRFIAITILILCQWVCLSPSVTAAGNYKKFSDLYSFPTQTLTEIRNRLLRDFYVRVESPGDVSLFVYDNDTFIVESFLPESVDVQLSLDPQYSTIQDLISGRELTGESAGTRGGFFGFGISGKKRLTYPIRIMPHSYRVFPAKRSADSQAQ